MCGQCTLVWYFSIGIIFLFMKSFIKDLNGLEIVIMYISVIRRAHKVHHKHMGKEQGECFGMLIVWKYLSKKKQMLKFDFK
jgi:hypothetical protein